MVNESKREVDEVDEARPNSTFVGASEGLKEWKGK
jgi:hypothetical protein